MAKRKVAPQKSKGSAGIDRLKNLRPVPRGLRNKMTPAQAKEFDEMLTYLNNLPRGERPLMSEVVATIIDHFGITTSEPAVRREMRRLLHA